MKGLDRALIETAFRLRRKRRSFSAANLAFSYSSMPKALTILVPAIVSWRRLLSEPQVNWVRVETLRIFWPNFVMG